MQDGDLAVLIELDAEIAKEIIPPQEPDQHWSKRGAKFDGAPRDRGDQGRLSLMMMAQTRPGVDPVFQAVREIDAQRRRPILRKA